MGYAPYGFVYQNKKLIPAEEEVEIVKLIRQKREMEQLSYSKIAKYLNQNLIPAKRGGNWYTETVKTVCTILFTESQSELEVGCAVLTSSCLLTALNQITQRYQTEHTVKPQ